MKVRVYVVLVDHLIVVVAVCMLFVSLAWGGLMVLIPGY
jgi:hypothetical protein